MKFLLNKYWLFTIGGLFTATAVLAQDDFGLYDTAKKALPTGTPDPVAIIATIIQIILSVIGVVAVILILYAGWQWMTAAGNEEKISQAKKIIAGAVVGLVLVFSSYIIANFVFKSISQTIVPGPSPAAVIDKVCDNDAQCSSDGSIICVNNKCQAHVDPCAGVCLEYATASLYGEYCTEAAVGGGSCNTGEGCFIPADPAFGCPP